MDSHAPNKLHEPIDVLVADSYNLDNNEIGIGQDCAATLGVVREIFTVASWSRSGWRKTLSRQICLAFYKILGLNTNMARKSIARIVRTSGIETSGNGKYFYWKCNVSGKETFATEERFNDVVKKYGSEEKLFKEYILRPVQKYIDAGFDSDTIKSIILANEGELPILETFKNPSIKVDKIELTVQPEQPKVLIFPWSGNPDYFKSPHVPLNFENETKNSCVYPNRNLNDRCFGCSIYDVCQSSVKYSLVDMHKKTIAGKVAKLKSF